MAEKPEWVKSFARPRGTEIKHIRGTGTSMRGAVSTTPRSRGVGRSRDDASARSRPRDLSPASAARRGLSVRGWQAPRLLGEARIR